ncbi:DUF4387 domain-containing protein [Bordetella sp. 15P40C-2]|uniref:DUF4387 domain-containing protein n=1 Tax=Bordetella sp. 15P40C-2 TaxID=2572246 RepID=UPI00132848BB|nr:DUF4387 domain-containing protein [Bordetella sp. 15P40C-2]MVW73022.1 DUF4387 family protein [Bordetella sp. 15P40C-2]
MSWLRDYAKVIRSKNSGPFEITFDVIFKSEADYQLVQRSGILTQESICSLFEVSPADIVTLMFFEPALAFKLTLKRSWEQGSVNERDTFGAQQHAPLLGVWIDTND